MAARDFFPDKPDFHPVIYAYQLVGVPGHAGQLKIGYTSRNVKQRVEEQLKTSRIDYKIVLEESAMRKDGTSFSDHDVHKVLKRKHFKNTDGEWYECSIEDVQAAVNELKTGIRIEGGRSLTFSMRPEQCAAIEKAEVYFRSFKAENIGKTPHFLWNAKMRFGKTFASYKLAKKMGMRKLLILTFKPAVHSAWEEDLNTHVDFEGWQFISSRAGTLDSGELDYDRPFVCFGSFQDFLGRNSAGGIKAKNTWVHETKWDLVILDEYHYGAWREKRSGLVCG